MKLFQFTNPEKYSCRSYLVLGTWGSLDDINTVVDPGVDDSIIDHIEKVYTGVGKKPVDLVVLTHNHFDHAGGVACLKERYNAKVMAMSKSEYVDQQFTDGDHLRFGDRTFEVIHLPAHSDDSVCFYCHEERLIFMGDNTLRIRNSKGSHQPFYLEFLKRMVTCQLEKAYCGHDPPVETGLQTMLNESIGFVSKAIELGKG